YLTIPNIDKAFQDDYIFQVFITKPSALRQVSGECDPSNLPLGTLVGHISDPANPVPRNPVPRNPVPRNPVPRNATLSDTLIQNTTFTLSSDTTAAEGGQPLSLDSLAPEGCDPVTGGGRFGECTLFAPREPGQLTITIRSYQIDEEPFPVWNPHGDLDAPQTLPSVIVADYWCTGPDSPDGCAFAQDGPELVPDVVTAGVAPETVRVGQTVTFPLSDFGYTNVGTQAAQEHRIGYYISTADSVSALPRNTDGTIDTSSPETKLLFSVAALALQPEDPATVSSAELTVPLDIPRPDDGTGTYYVWVYVDDQRVVSEIDEDNNFIRGGPITVVPANEPPSNIEFGTVVDAREGEPVTLTVTFDDPGDAGEGYTYVWDFGDGTTCDSSVTPDDCGMTTVHIYEDDGLYTLTVTIIDSGGLDGTGSVEVEILNVAPTVDAGPDVTIDEGGTFTSFGSFVDLGADTWTATVDYDDGSGVQSLALNTDQTFSLSRSYAADGVYTVTVTVSDDDGGSTSDTATVTVANVAPVVNSQSVTTNEDTAIGITLTGSDAGGDSLAFAVLFGPSSGSLSGTAPSLTYSPAENFNGADSFTFQANDGGSENNLSNVATVTITVIAVNDPPVLSADSTSTNEDIQLTIPVLLNDNDDADNGSMDPGSVTITGPPSNGNTTVGPAGVITYTPNENFNGVDSFQYQACDLGEPTPVLCGEATVSITISPINDNPVAVDDVFGTNEDVPLTVGAPGVLGNDIDVDGVSLTATLISAPAQGTLNFNDDGSFSFTPPENIFGAFSFTYTASDGELPSGVATATITVLPVNDNPVANDDSYLKAEGASLVVASPGILDNDSDVDGDSLTAELVTAAPNGTVVVDADGGFSYTPNSGFFGSDSFSYEALDGNGGSDSAAVTVGVPYGFIGLLSPWREQPLYTINRGSSFPISWQYTDPATGQLVDSENAMIEVRIKGAFQCNVGENGDTVEVIQFPGNSDYRYSSGTHKLNWDTDGQELGCYNIRIYSGLTGQVDGPFKLKIRK
ncbi:MAG: Ig-like domain-containing protein, partial [Thermoanaerobaculia bacterium]